AEAQPRDPAEGLGGDELGREDETEQVDDRQPDDRGDDPVASGAVREGEPPPLRGLARGVLIEDGSAGPCHRAGRYGRAARLTRQMTNLSSACHFRVTPVMFRRGRQACESWSPRTSPGSSRSSPAVSRPKASASTPRPTARRRLGASAARTQPPSGPNS